MPGAGTDKTKRWVETPGPVVILVEPQLGENIGAAARAMANFGLSRLRLVAPRQGWPNEKAVVMAAGADRVLDGAQIFATFDDAIADCHYVIACTARAHYQEKPVVGAGEAAALLAPKVANGETVALVFGRERNGLESHEVGRADAVLTLPVNPAFASLNLAQAVVVTAYEWFKLATNGQLPFTKPDRSPPAPKQQLDAFFNDLEGELDRIEFFRPHEKRGTMTINLRNIVNRMTPTEQDIRTLHGVFMALAHGRKGPARGGTLDGTQAEALRAVLAERNPADNETPARGLAKLLRRNPTEAERALWQALTNDKRFAGLGFKRQTPIGPHIVDFVSFPQKCVIDLVPSGEDEAAAQARDNKRVWLEEHDYKVIVVSAAAIDADVAKTLDAIGGALERRPSPSQS
ncbi:MAG: TrmJ/YjtD family RNA methyltransferase [Pseudolabrys sp.]|nr:TrmJ/YjtD family RNA methyltransferase [Pseudolabrys sp.]